jgi:hypothetical protein
MLLKAHPFLQSADMGDSSQCQVLILEKVKREDSFEEHKVDRVWEKHGRLLQKNLVKEFELNCPNGLRHVVKSHFNPVDSHNSLPQLVRVKIDV